MPPREWRLRIEDMLEAADRCHRYVAGMDYGAFAADQKLIDAVVRNLEIIGEVARYIPLETEARYPEIPWVDIRNMRHRIAHGYFAVDVGVVWNTVTTSLAALIPSLERLLRQEGPPSAGSEPGRETGENA